MRKVTTPLRLHRLRFIMRIILLFLRAVLVGYGLSFFLWIILFPTNVPDIINNELPPDSLSKFSVLFFVFTMFSLVLRLSEWWACIGLVPILIDRLLFTEYFGFAASVLLLLGYKLLSMAEVIQNLKNISIVKVISRKASLVLLIALCVTLVIRLIYGLKLLHIRFETLAFDLGIFENIFWNSIHGRFFESSIENGSHLGVHFSPTIASMFLIYRIFPRTETLFVVSSFAMVFAAIPLFLYAEKVLKDWGLAWIVAFLYLLHPATTSSVYYDFHEIKLLPIVFFSAMYSFERKKMILSFLFFVAAALIKEDVGLSLISIGIALTIGSRHKRFGILLSVFGLIYFPIIKFVIMPHLRNSNIEGFNYISALINPKIEGNIRGLLATFLFNPIYTASKIFDKDKWLFLIQMFFPVLFSTCMSVKTFCMMAVPLLMTLFSNLEAMHSISLQASIAFLGPCFVSLVWFLGEFKSERSEFKIFSIFLSSFRKQRQRNFAVVLSIWALVIGVVWQLNLGVLIRPEGVKFRFGETLTMRISPDQLERYERISAKLKIIPEAASVTASETLCPHLSRRKAIYTYRFAAEETDFFVLWNDDRNEKFDSLVRSSEKYHLKYSDSDISIFERVGFRLES